MSTATETAPATVARSVIAPATAAELAVVRAARQRRRPRVVVVTLGLVAGLVTAVCVALTIGSYPISPVQVPSILLGYGAPDVSFIINELRLPRVACGVLVGLAFGMSGAIFQSVVQNELASPDVIGITAGASAMAVVMIVVVGSSVVHLSLAALLGAAATASMIYVLAYRKGVTGYRLILIGIGCAALLGAGTEYLMLKAEREELQRAGIWLVGSLNGSGWEKVVPLAVSLVLPTLAAVVLRRQLRGLQLGDEAAVGIGVRVHLSKAGLLLAGTALAAFATAAAGPVAFVAFVAAPIARRLLDNGDPGLVVSGLVGALLLTSADLVSRFGIAGFELPVGILTGIMGAPYLVWLLIKTNRSSTGD